MRIAVVGAFRSWIGIVALGSTFWGWVLIPGATADEPAKAKKPAPTYAKDVAPILQAKCLNCHRKHQVGPFALENYEQARKRAKDIAGVTSERSMPPWKPTPGVGPKLKHDQSLTHDEVAVFAAWADSGAAMGDPKDLPPPPKFSEGWKLGTPDLVLEPAEGHIIPASGPDSSNDWIISRQKLAGLSKSSFSMTHDMSWNSPRLEPIKNCVTVLR